MNGRLPSTPISMHTAHRSTGVHSRIIMTEAIARRWLDSARQVSVMNRLK